MKSMVALLCILAIVSCTDNIPAESDTQRVMDLKNMIQISKPEFSMVDSRTEGNNNSAWTTGDELLMKVSLKNKSNEGQEYVACAKLVYTNDNEWSILEGQNYSTSDLNLLLMDNTTLKVVIPDELGIEPEISTVLYYAPDLEWKSLGSLGIEENPSTTAPEYWEYISSWSTGLARIIVQTESGKKVEISGVKDYIDSENSSFEVTTDENGKAYFYCKFESSNKITIKQESEVVFQGSDLNVDKEFEARKTYSYSIN